MTGSGRQALSTREPASLASTIEAELRALAGRSVPELRAVRRAWSRRLRAEDGAFVLAVARRLHRALDDRRWVALELIRFHGPALSRVTEKDLEVFGRGLDSWGSVDAFAGLLAGPAWLRGRVADATIRSWTRSRDRWRRRAALAATVVLNTPSHGGRGDARRTLDICSRLVEDRDDMVVKALSWALRKLAERDPAVVGSFLKDNRDRLAARVLREVSNKLETGLKNPKTPRRRSSTTGRLP